MQKPIHYAFLTLFILFVSVAQAATIYVDASAIGTNSGSSWTNAFTSLQSAVASAVSGDEVWVAAGTYIPSAYPVGRTSTDIREYSFYLESGVEYYGGFAGTETLRSQRDYANNATILSGNITGNNCYHVLVSANESSVVLDGFTVTAGYANGGTNATINGQSGFWANNGGGIFTASTTMTVANCIISNNTAGYGGAIKGLGGTTTLTNCTLTGNTGTAHAGAIDMSGTLVVSGCTFTSNTTATSSNGNGGAIKISGGGATISNTSFTSNVGRIGGAIHHYNSQLTISTSTFSNNSATNHGGALYASHTAFTVTKCVFDGNTATNNGGGISTGWGATMTLNNSVFSENTSGSSGGAISNDMINGSAINCTFYANTAAVRGGAYSSAQTSNHINGKNCVFFGNKKGTSTNVAGADTYGGSFTYSLTQSNSNFNTGTGIVNNQDPLFRNASDPDGADNVWMTADDGLSFFSNSPAYGVGTSSGAPSTDITGASRASSPSIGAYEGFSYTRHYVDASATGTNTGTSWANAFTSLQSAVAAATAGVEVWVAAGTYIPSAYPVGRTSTDIREYSFYLESGVEYYGGFAGTETLRSQRDYANNATILSGNITGNNCYHVLVSANESSVVLDGFTVTAGYANGGTNATINGQSGFWANNGGGIFTASTTMTVANCIISNNTAGYGGAIKGLGGTTTLTNCTLTGNTGTAHAGAIDMSGTLVVSGCTFTSNTTATSSNGNGGAIKISGGGATISNTSFTSNVGRIGGAIHHYNSQLTISTSTFSNNSATNHGGALYASHTAFTVTKCVFDGNTATNNGGGISTGWGATMTLNNSVFSENTSGSSGGAISNDMINGSAINCTFYANTAAVRGGAYSSAQTSNHINGKNCVFFGNKKGTSTNVAGADTYGGSFTYSLTQSNSNFNTGTGIVNNQDPLFRNASDPDGADNVWMTADDGLSFFSNSPAYGVGTSSGAPSTDITGASRASSPSIGAYEGVSYTRYLVDIDATGTNAGTSWTNAYTELQDAIDASSVGDEIWVAEGVYIPNVIPQFQYTSILDRNKTFAINKNIEIYGGFDGTESILSQRDAKLNITVLSGDLGTIGSVADNCYHVVMTANLNSTAIIDGLTVQDGNANGGNTTNQYGGRNFARELGGGIANNQSSPTLSNLIIKNNRAKNGAGVSNRVSNSNLINLTFIDNIATQNGGGVANIATGSPSIINCVFSGNLADDFGGGIYSENSPTLTSCSFYNNTATTTSRGGGGIYAKNAGTTTVSNCIFFGNKIGSSTTNVSSDIKNGTGHTTTVDYSLVQLASGSYTSGNNNALTSATNMVYNQDPLFVNASDPDGADNVWMTKDDGLKLKSTSPAVDAGLNSAISSYSTDIMVTPRVVNTTVNMGAYELLACQQGNALPTAASTYTASYADTDGNYTCYCDDNGQFILGLDLNSTGAVVPTTGVSLEIGATTTTSWSTAGGIITNVNGGTIINRKWDVVPTTQPTSDVTVIYPFTNTEYSDAATALGVLGTTITNVNQLEMYKLTSSGTFADPHASGATGVALPHGASASTSNWVWSQHGNGTDHLATYKVASFSGGGGGGGASGNPLPVELIHFDAQAAANHTADLHWVTASEINNSHFEIERSYDGRTFETVGNVTGNGTTSHLIDYNYTDETIAKSQNTAYYRLKQVDYDGAYEYSDVRVVRFDKRADRLEIAAYPNPFNQEVTIHVNANEPYAIQVTDINGVVVLSVDHTESRTHRLDVSEYTAGVYIIEVTSNQGTKHLKVIKQ